MTTEQVNRLGKWESFDAIRRYLDARHGKPQKSDAERCENANPGYEGELVERLTSYIQGDYAHFEDGSIYRIPDDPE